MPLGPDLRAVVVVAFQVAKKLALLDWVGGDFFFSSSLIMSRLLLLLMKMRKMTKPCEELMKSVTILWKWKHKSFQTMEHPRKGVIHKAYMLQLWRSDFKGICTDTYTVCSPKFCGVWVMQSLSFTLSQILTISTSCVVAFCFALLWRVWAMSTYHWRHAGFLKAASYCHFPPTVKATGQWLMCPTRNEFSVAQRDGKCCGTSNHGCMQTNQCSVTWLGCEERWKTASQETHKVDWKSCFIYYLTTTGWLLCLHCECGKLTLAVCSGGHH